MTGSAHRFDRFPAERPAGRPFDVPPEYRRLFGESRIPEVILPTGQRAHLIGRHADLRTVLSGPVSADGQQPGFPMAREGSRSNSAALSFFRMDGADHRRYRKLVTGQFTLAQVERLRPAVQQAVDALIDDMARKRPPVDLVADFALPLPSLVICQILGVPYQDRREFQSLSDVLARGPERGREQFMRAIIALRDYVEKLASQKRDTPADDLLSTLISRFDQDPTLDSRQLAVIILLLLVAGHETTASMISLGTLALLSHPDQRDMLADKPALITSAVEELLRYISIAQWIPRVAIGELVVAGQRIQPGEGIVALPIVANRDPDVFSEPDRLDITRPVLGHVAFGFGPHQCVGLQLARMELEAAYETILRRIPGLRTAVAASQLSLRQRAAMFSVEELPVTWQEAKDEIRSGRRAAD
jgi:cytochrome P450